MVIYLRIETHIMVRRLKVYLCSQWSQNNCQALRYHLSDARSMNMPFGHRPILFDSAFSTEINPAEVATIEVGSWQLPVAVPSR